MHKRRAGHGLRGERICLGLPVQDQGVLCRSAAELPGGLKAPHVRTSHPMPRSRAMTRHAASGLAFMAIACLRVGGRAWVCACAMCWRSGLASGVLAWVWVPWEVV